MTELPAYILAGGRSQRFGSDKARADIAGMPMLAAIARRVEPMVTRVTVVAERRGVYDDLGVETIADPTPDRGPLGGLLAALRHAEHAVADRLLLLACDQPGVDEDWLAPLRANAADADVVAYAADAPALAHPMPTVYSTRLLATVETMLDGPRTPGPQRLIRLLHDQGRVRLLTARRPLVDVNTPELLPERT